MSLHNYKKSDIVAIIDTRGLKYQLKENEDHLYFIFDNTDDAWNTLIWLDDMHPQLSRKANACIVSHGSYENAIEFEL